MFRQEYGFDPDQGWVQQLITAGVSGKLPSIFGEILESNDIVPEGSSLNNLGRAFFGKYDWSNDWFVRNGKKLWQNMIHGKKK